MNENTQTPEVIESDALATLKAEAESNEQKPVTKEEVAKVAEDQQRSDDLATGSAATAVATIVGVVQMLVPGIQVDMDAAADFEKNLGAVMKKHGLYAGGNYGEEIALLSSAGLFGWGLYQGIQNQVAANVLAARKKVEALAHAEE